MTAFHGIVGDGIGVSLRRKLCLLVPAHWEATMAAAEYQAKVLVDYLLRRYDVDIAYLTPHADPRLVPSGYRIVSFSERPGLKRSGSPFDTLRLYSALCEERPDVILQFVGCEHTAVAALYARLHGCAMISRLTSDRSVDPVRVPWTHIHRHIERWCLEFGARNSSLVLAQTDYQRRQLAPRIGWRRVRVLPDFHPSPPDRAPRRAAGARIVWVADLHPGKNPGAFLRLARGFAARPELRFVMASATVRDDDWTRATLADIATTPNVDYHGNLGQAAVDTLLESADLLVDTSYDDNVSSTFIHAWLRRVPIVSLYVDPDELLVERGLGVVAGDEDSLRARVARLLQAPKERAAIGARARVYALANHAEANIESLAQLLELRARPVQPRSSSSSSRSSISSRTSSVSS